MALLRRSARSHAGNCSIGERMRRAAELGRARGRASRQAAAAESLETRTLLTTYVVDVATDGTADGDGSSDGNLSLREALIAATTDAAFGDADEGEAGEQDVILFADGITTISASRVMAAATSSGLFEWQLSATG